MHQKKIIFRADGGPTIGMGHFTRTLALAEMLNENFRCIFATQSPTDYQINEINKVCHERLDIPEDESHFDFFLSCLNGNEIVTLDNYYFTTDYQRSIKAKGCKLVCIDDNYNKHYVSDIVINHAEGIKKSLFSIETYTKLCLGYRYALLRNDFFKGSYSNNKKKYSCFIMMGATDPCDIIFKILSIINPQNQQLPVAVVVGPTYQNEKQLNTFQNIEVFKGITSSTIIQLMLYSKFGILPASTAAIEACAVRLPHICGYFIDNQYQIYTGIKKNNLAICVGNYLELEVNKLISAITEISQTEISEKIKANQISFLDKKSNKRLRNVFNRL